MEIAAQQSSDANVKSLPLSASLEAEPALQISETRKPQPPDARQMALEALRERWRLQRRLEQELPPLQQQVEEELPRLRKEVEELPQLQKKFHELEITLQDADDLREKRDGEIRDFLKKIVKVVDRCDNLLETQRPRLELKDPNDPSVQTARDWLERLARIRRDLDSLLRNYGVDVRVPVGKPNPDLDEIIQVVASTEVSQDEIVEVVRTGYVWRGAILRLSAVTVAAGQ